jgi:hypothetical protein
MIALGLLSAVTDASGAGERNDLSERCEETDSRDIRAVLRFGKGFRVLGEEIGNGLIVALTEKIGFADGGVRERSLEGEEGLRDQ